MIVSSNYDTQFKWHVPVLEYIEWIEPPGHLCFRQLCFRHKVGSGFSNPFFRPKALFNVQGPECDVCKDAFRDDDDDDVEGFREQKTPRFLSCGHTFCQTCLLRLPELENQPAITIACPTCRSPTKLGKALSEFMLNSNLCMQCLSSQCYKSALFIFSILCSSNFEIICTHCWCQI